MADYGRHQSFPRKATVISPADSNDNNMDTSALPTSSSWQSRTQSAPYIIRAEPTRTTSAAGFQPYPRRGSYVGQTDNNGLTAFPSRSAPASSITHLRAVATESYMGLPLSSAAGFDTRYADLEDRKRIAATLATPREAVNYFLGQEQPSRPEFLSITSAHSIQSSCTDTPVRDSQPKHLTTAKATTLLGESSSFASTTTVSPRLSRLETESWASELDDNFSEEGDDDDEAIQTSGTDDLPEEIAPEVLRAAKDVDYVLLRQTQMDFMNQAIQSAKRSSSGTSSSPKRLISPFVSADNVQQQQQQPPPLTSTRHVSLQHSPSPYMYTNSNEQPRSTYHDRSFSRDFSYYFPLPIVSPSSSTTNSSTTSLSLVAARRASAPSDEHRRRFESLFGQLPLM